MSLVEQAELTGAVCDLCRSDRHAVPVLEAGDYEYGVPAGFTLSRCTACDFYYQTPDRRARPFRPTTGRPTRSTATTRWWGGSSGSPSGSTRGGWRG